jgi:hypothetical protein
MEQSPTTGRGGERLLVPYSHFLEFQDRRRRAAAGTLPTDHTPPPETNPADATPAAVTTVHPEQPS